MHVWWGPDLTVFYNDAYVPAMGDKHPDALGRPASRVWAEAWSELGPLAESVLAGEGATFSEDQQLFLRRHGYLEETYWTFSYSPIQDESGGVGGVFVAVTDTTRRVVGERRLRVLRDLGELSTCRPAPRRRRAARSSACWPRHRADVPFVAAYLRSPDGSLQLVAASGVTAGSAVRRATLPARPTAGRCGGSPKRRRRRSSGAWSTAPRTRSGACSPGRRSPTDAVVLPLSSPDGPSPPACSWPG